MGTVLSFPDMSLTATLSGGSWQAANPLGNLQNPQLAVKARSADAAAASTKVRADLGAARSIQCIAILSHNLSFGATVRARGYSDSAYTTMVTGADTGTVYAWPQSLTSEQAADYPDHWIFAFSSGKSARYWETEIVDTANVDSRVEFGRLWIGEGTFVPIVSISHGSTLGYESRDTISESLGGAVWGNSQIPRRVAVISFGALTAAEKRKGLIMQKTLGKTGELLYVMDSDSPPEDMILESFPATIRQADSLKYPMFNNNEMPVELMEIFNSSNITYSKGGNAADVKARE